MRSSKGFLALCAVVVMVVSSVAVGGALISSSTGKVIRLSVAPASARLNALQNGTNVYAFDEKQGATLTAAVAVDAVNPGTYGSFPSGSATIPAGTLVNSHLIHSDIPIRNFTARRTGTVTFANDIIGVVASTARLAASDTLGAVGTLYPGTQQWRGLESSENGFSSVADKFTISADRRTISFDVNTYVMDQIRVITSHGNPLVTSITDTPDPVQAGNDVTYVVTVTNTGSSAASGVSVRDEFPGATFVSATSSGGCTAASTTVTCSLGTIAAGGSADATIIVTSPTTVPASGNLVNTASSPPGVNPMSTATTIVVAPELTTTITDAPDPVTAGNDVQYTLTVTNNGIAPVANVHVVDTLPPGTTLFSAPDNCSGTGPVDCALGSLGVLESAEVQLVVTSPSVVPEVGTITNTAVATPGDNSVATQTTTVEEPTDGVAKGFVSPGGSLTIPGDDPATLTLPDTGDGAPVVITQGDGTFCDGPCDGTTTTISDFAGYNDPNEPIHVELVYNFPASDPNSLTNAATAFGQTIYKNTDPENPSVGSIVPTCTTLGAGNAIPSPCEDARTISHLGGENYVVTFEIVYLSGDPKYGRR